MTTQTYNIAESTQHISEEELNAFVSAPDAADFTSLRLHIASCQECQAKAEALQLGHTIIGNNVEVIARFPATPLKSRLHEATHQRAMENFQTTSTHVKEPTKNNERRSSWLHAIFQFEINWLALPATAIASVLAVIVFMGQNQSPQTNDGNINLISFQESQGMVFHTQQLPTPGLGFFNESDQSVQQYSGFEITRNANGKLLIQWPKVDNAETYTLSLQEVSNNINKEITNTHTTSTQWQVEQSQLRPGVLYRLHLTGKTSEQLNFHYSGGFVFQ